MKPISDEARRHGRQEERREQDDTDQPGRLHARALRGPAHSDRALHVWVSAITTKVMATRSGRSRAVAAIQASCPMPGRSQSASMGMAAPKAMLTLTPASARSCGAM